MTFDDLRSAASGRTYLDHAGIECTYRVEYRHDSWGVLRTSITGEPTPAGKLTRAYQETRRVLHDDWVADLYQSPDSEIDALTQIYGGTERLSSLLEDEDDYPESALHVEPPTSVKS